MRSSRRKGLFSYEKIIFLIQSADYKVPELFYMQHIRHLCAGLLFIGFTTFAFAEDVTTASSEIDTSADPQAASSSSLKELKNIKAKDLKVDANAAQPDNVKDPLQP